MTSVYSDMDITKMKSTFFTVCRKRKVIKNKKKEQRRIKKGRNK